MAATSVHPFKITRRDDDLETNVRRTVGFRAECSCGYNGPVRAKPETARWDRLVHRSAEHGAR